MFPPLEARITRQERGRLELLTHIHGANTFTQPVGEERETLAHRKSVTGAIMGSLGSGPRERVLERDWETGIWGYP